MRNNPVLPMHVSTCAFSTCHTCSIHMSHVTCMSHACIQPFNTHACVHTHIQSFNTHACVHTHIHMSHMHCVERSLVHMCSVSSLSFASVISFRQSEYHVITTVSFNMHSIRSHVLLLRYRSDKGSLAFDSITCHHNSCIQIDGIS